MHFTQSMFTTEQTRVFEKNPFDYDRNLSAKVCIIKEYTLSDSYLFFDSYQFDKYLPDC